MLAFSRTGKRTTPLFTILATLLLTLAAATTVVHAIALPEQQQQPKAAPPAAAGPPAGKGPGKGPGPAPGPGNGNGNGPPTPPGPGEDPFYTPPPNFRRLPNGSIIRSRQLSNATYTFRTPISSVYQILYKTQDPIGHKDISTALTAIVPASQAALTTRNVLIYQVPYDAAQKACGPSYLSASNRTADPTGGGGQLVDLALAQGLTVLLTDYEGPDAGFTVGLLSGEGVIDGVRALLDFKPVIPSRKDTQLVFEGFSGGALATGWALQVQPTYAPELSSMIKGAAFGGIPRNLTNDLLLLDGSVASGLVVSSIAGQAAIFPELQRFLNKHLNDAGKEAIAFARDNCLDAVSSKYPYTRFFETFTDLTQDEGLADPTVREVQAQLLLAAPGSTLSPVPQFVYSGTADTIVPHQDTVDYYNVQCARNVKSLTLLNVQGLDHSPTAAAVQPNQARNFLLQRLAGVPAPQGCSESTYVPPPTTSTTKRSAIEESLLRAYYYGPK